MSDREKVRTTARRILGYIPNNIDEYSTLSIDQMTQALRTRRQYNHDDMRYEFGSQADMPIRAPLQCMKLSTSESLSSTKDFGKKDRLNQYTTVAYKYKSAGDVLELLNSKKKL